MHERIGLTCVARAAGKSAKVKFISAPETAANRAASTTISETLPDPHRESFHN
jgi:hypothetical protein